MNQRISGGMTGRSQARHGRRSAPGEPQAGYILIIDDSPAILTMLTTLLGEIEGYSVWTAQSAREALRVTPPEAPALILLDLRLPGESTNESVRQLRRRADWARAPLVISSGHQQIATFARELRADAYLPKPFDLDAVSALARRYVILQSTTVPGACATTPHRTGAGTTEAIETPDDIPTELLGVEMDGADDIVQP